MRFDACKKPTKVRKPEKFSATQMYSYEKEWLKLDLIPTEIIPKKRHIVGNLEWAILIKESKLTTASWSSCQPYDHWVALAAPRFKEKVEHPAKFSCVRNNNNARALI